jgi:UDP-N-acetylmuramoyl-tripeptide--D-alanyl-D-alanine ligase
VIELTPAEIATACGARLVAGDADARAGDRPRRAVVDSREVESGDLFFGLPGERADGGQFASAALEAGAWGAVVGEAHAQRLASATRRVLVASDPLTALHGLAGRWLAALRKSGCRVVGITGSTGKTSTKDILASMLEPVARTHSNRENWNTEIGLPLTVLEADEGVELMVLEMAMRGMGQIRELARIARPEVGLITNVGPVHLELVGTVERVAEAKAELIAELAGGATCVVPAAEEALRPHLRTDVRTVTFAQWLGTDAGGDPLSRAAAVADAAADVRVLSVTPSTSGLRAAVVAGAERETFEFGFTQAHNVTNALAAIGAAHALGFPLGRLVEGAARARLSSLRGEELELPGGILIINDCYNANPVSMRAALDHLAQVAARRGSARAIAVLGEMRELGPDAEHYHEEVGRQAAGTASLVVAVGDHGAAYLRGYGNAGEAVLAAGADDAADLLRDVVREGDVVLVKGSRAVGLERVAEALTAGSGTPWTGSSKPSTSG